VATPLTLVLAGVAACAFSGVPPLLAGTRRADRVATALAVLGALLGLSGAAAAFAAPAQASSPWPLPGASLSIGLDGLSALFLLPVFAIPALAAIYGLGYHAHGRALRLCQGLLTAGMALVVLARNGVLFLCGWEAMALSAFFLIGSDRDSPPARRAAWVYLVATHLGTACLLAAFALLAPPGGNLDFAASAAAPHSGARAVWIFALALVGFGLKAGLMPLHVWLPAAHAHAPSHVSAVLSGVMIKTGAYGVLRVATLLAPLPAACGAVVLGLGALTALLAIAAALAQSDQKRFLAYSSIENIGIVFAGIGAALLGRALGRAELVVLGLGGALLHVLNHGTGKPLLFLAAGSVIQATGTREMDRHGGLLRRMPRTGVAFLAGAASLSGLPLLNCFAGELLLYLALFHAAALPAGGVTLLAVAALAALALAGGLALVAFTRAAGTVLLGRARSRAAAEARESPPTMTVPTLALAAACALLGLLPTLCVPLLERAIAACGMMDAPPALRALAPFRALSIVAASCALALALAWIWLRKKQLARDPAGAPGTWDCGYVDASAPRLQYTGASFAQPAGRMLRWVQRVRAQAPAPLELFPGARAFAQSALEPLLDGVLWPMCRRIAERCSQLRVLQRGKLQIYLLYILVVLVVLLAWTAVAPGGPA
jgi:formate hydrogenlyase subunit 3/multisubunit Na+/H+ antiporter MnhD subunit